MGSSDGWDRDEEEEVGYGGGTGYDDDDDEDGGWTMHKDHSDSLWDSAEDIEGDDDKPETPPPQGTER